MSIAVDSDGFKRKINTAPVKNRLAGSQGAETGQGIEHEMAGHEQRGRARLAVDGARTRDIRVTIIRFRYSTAGCEGTHPIEFHKYRVICARRACDLPSGVYDEIGLAIQADARIGYVIRTHAHVGAGGDVARFLAAGLRRQIFLPGSVMNSGASGCSGTGSE